MRILVTGAAGFIGFHLCKSLLEDGYDILGIDNINHYFDPNLKLARLDQLESYDNFIFEKVALLFTLILLFFPFSETYDEFKEVLK